MVVVATSDAAVLVWLVGATLEAAVLLWLAVGVTPVDAKFAGGPDIGMWEVVLAGAMLSVEAVTLSSPAASILVHLSQTTPLLSMFQEV